MKKHQIPMKMSGEVRWNKEDKSFDFKGEDEMDRPYVQMPNSLMIDKEKEREMEKDMLESLYTNINSVHMMVIYNNRCQRTRVTIRRLPGE